MTPLADALADHIVKLRWERPRANARRVGFCNAKHIANSARPHAGTGCRLRRNRVTGLGLTDGDIAEATNASESAVVARRRAVGVTPTFHSVDSCAGEVVAVPGIATAPGWAGVVTARRGEA